MTSERKQILLVETDEQVRIAVESALRQDGFEVVSVDSADRAEGILSVSTFDVALIGTEIQDDSGLYAISWLASEERAQTPFAILCQQEVMIPELPEELVLRYPFPPEVIQNRVRELLGEQPAAAPDETQQIPAGGDATLFGGSDVGEEFLDQALGLDQLEVNESETMNTGDTTNPGQKTVSESLVGYEADVTSISSTQHTVTGTGEISIELAKKASSDSQKGAPPQKEVELVTDHGQTPPPPTPPPTPAKQPPISAEAPETDQQHDYNWFISEMQGDPQKSAGAPVLPAAQPAAAQPPKKKSPKKQSAEEFTKMVKKDISGATAATGRTKVPVKAGAKTKTRQPVRKATQPVQQIVDEGVFDWHDNPDESAQGSVAAVFSGQMAEAVAKEVADRLLKQLNSDKFTKLVESEIKKYVKKHS